MAYIYIYGSITAVWTNVIRSVLITTTFVQPIKFVFEILISLTQHS